MITAHRVFSAPAALTALVIVCGLVAAGLPTAARAEESIPTWSVQPGGAAGPDGRSAIEATVDAGSVVHDIVVVTNHSEFPVTYALYPLDARNNSEDGSFALADTAEENSDLGSWITFAADPGRSPCNSIPLPEGCPPLPVGATALTLGAGETASIPVAITVPLNATAGDHAAGLVAAWLYVSTGGDGQPLALEQRVGARVYIRVLGDLVYRAAFTGFTGGYGQSWNPLGGDATVRYHLENDGNVRMHVDQVVVLTGPFGIELGRSEPMRAEHLNPGQRIAVNYTFPGIAPLFALTATAYAVAVGADGVAAPVIEQSTTVWALPWLLVLLLAAVAGIVVLLVVRRRRHRERLALTIEQAREAAFAQARAQEHPATTAPGPFAPHHRSGGGEQ